MTTALALFLGLESFATFVCATAQEKPWKAVLDLGFAGALLWSAILIWRMP